MTNEEAIVFLNKIKDRKNNIFLADYEYEALDMAIKALEKQIKEQKNEN